MNISIEKIYKQKIEELAKLFNFSYEDAERFFLFGFRGLLK